MSHDGDPDLTPCIQCGTEIKTHVSICRFCNSFQEPWRNILRFWGNVVGVFAVVGAAVSFILTNWSEINKVFVTREAVELLGLQASFHGHVSIQLVNSGNTRLWIDTVLLQVKIDHASSAFPVRIAQVVLPQNILSHNKKANPDADKIRWTFPSIPDPTERKAMISAAVGLNNPCLDLQFFDKNNSSLETIRSFTPALVEEEIEVELRAFSLETSKKYSFKAGAVAVLVVQEDCE